MKKTNVLWTILNLIFLIVFNVLFFVIGGSEHKVSVWLSYAFIHFAYLMLVFTPILLRKGKSAAVFGFSLYWVSTVYFLVEFITGVVFILVSPVDFSTALLVQLGIAGLYGIMLVSVMIANERTADAEETRQYEIDYVMNASMKLKLLYENTRKKDTKKRVEKVYDALTSSPVKTHPSAAQVESQILLSIGELEDAVSNEQKDEIVRLSDSLLVSIRERNQQIKRAR